MREAYRGRPGAGERAFLERVRARLPAAPDGEQWVGDDAAVLADGGLLATDALVDGVHFDLAWASPADVGWKALAVNLSDLAAMGGAPVAAVAAVVVPPEPAGLADGVLDGLEDAATVLGCPLVGGDTTSGGQLVVTVSVVGVAPPTGAVLRSGAHPGDLVFVTGPLGGASAAWRVLARGGAPPEAALQALRRPVPRLTAGRAAATAGVTAMIDVSDGLATDLGHLCEESGVGVKVDAPAVPLGEGAGLDDALGGGDDYELCFTAPNRGAVVEAFVAAELPEPAVVGEITADPRRALVDADGREAALPQAGWEHPVP